MPVPAQAVTGQLPSDEQVASELRLDSPEAVSARLVAGAEAHGRLVACNLGLVCKVAAAYRNSCGVAYEDLYQVPVPPPLVFLVLLASDYVCSGPTGSGYPSGHHSAGGY